ncbi:MAG TPA: hypothetical protein PK514_06975 [Spirochaetota bacterium]|nr:hypothetical protein [Spirochaetota bacterium]
MKHVAFLMLAIPILFSCGASADKRLVAKINSLYSVKAGRAYGASKNFSQPMPYAVGQYVVTGTTDDDGDRTISSIAITGKQGRAWIFEFYTLTGSSESAMQICMSGMETAARTGNMDAVEIIWMKTRDGNGEIQKIEGPMLTMMKAAYKKTIVSLQVNVSGIQNGGPIKVPAGVFNATKMIKGEASFLGKTYRSTSWYHTSVPVNGMVKSTTDDGDMVTELLDFGFKVKESRFK